MLSDAWPYILIILLCAGLFLVTVTYDEERRELQQTVQELELRLKEESKRPDDVEACEARYLTLMQRLDLCIYLMRDGTGDITEKELSPMGM